MEFGLVSVNSDDHFRVRGQPDRDAQLGRCRSERERHVEHRIIRVPAPGRGSDPKSETRTRIDSWGIGCAPPDGPLRAGSFRHGIEATLVGGHRWSVRADGKRCAMRLFHDIDLETQGVTTRELHGDEVVNSGRYLIAKTLLERGAAEVDPLGPDNPLIFSVGPVCRYRLFETRTGPVWAARAR